MAGALRTLGVLLVVAGAVAAAVATMLVRGDAQFAEIAEAYARHPDHALFRADYLTAAAWHYGVIGAGVVALLVGLAGGGMLLGIGELLRRVPPREDEL
jgi:hypothetical protein